ncbi:MAG: anthranilate synthase component I [Candidatus Omnitrophica bacterium]|nr:anthranilate synthase component I [Candidatus Omnitrophota bacterium]
MIKPSLSEFRKLAKRGNLIPVYAEILADLETPVTLFLKLAKNEKKAFLLESAEIEERIGRYSFVGIHPSATIEITKQSVIVKTDKKKKVLRVKNQKEVYRHLRNLIHEYRYVSSPHLPNFVGGLIGYLGYEFVQFCDDIKLNKDKKSIPLPQGLLFLMKNILIYDHFERTIQLVYLADCKNKNLIHVYQDANRALHQMVKKIKSQTIDDKLIRTSSQSAHLSTKTSSNMTHAQFMSKVKKIKSYIRAGDCIQVVLSQRFRLGKIKDGFQTYRVLRSLNPSPYMFYFQNENLQLIGSSPETLVKKTGANAETRPIAGTRPRGKTVAEDQKLEAQLKKSTKEMAEHLMLVDLGRNDLGRVCIPKSVQVKTFAEVERYSHVMHLVSSVQGTLEKGTDAFDLLKACFPAGTVTGAPKIRAMQIIDELEGEERGPYAGAVGYFSFSGDMDVCITIRTIMVYNKIAYVQAGAGIVNDSNPAREYQETINKAKALMQAVQLANRTQL